MPIIDFHPSHASWANRGRGWFARRTHGTVSPSDGADHNAHTKGAILIEKAKYQGAAVMTRLSLSIWMLCLPSLAHAGDWPQFLGPARNGVSDETGLATSWPADGPRVVWQHRVGQGWSGPVVAGERLVLFHR